MKKTIIFFLGIGVLAWAGCSDQPMTPQAPVDTAPQAQYVPPDLQKMLDRYTISDEGVASDPSLVAVNLSSALMVPDTGYDVYAVTFLWGSLLTGVQPPIIPTDWTGKLWVNGVARVDVRYTIDFEPGEDSLVPVDIPSAAAWVSQTAGDVDGISTLVFLKRGITYFMQPTLTFETKPFTISLPFDKLERLTAFYKVDNSSGVAILARRISYNACPAGLIKGEWIKEDIAGQKGTFSGIWVDRWGTPIGVMSGRFWTNEDGYGEFSGHLSGIQLTVVIAELKGVWRYDDPRMCPICGAGRGVFRGSFRYLNEDISGQMRGEFGDFSLPPDQLKMPLIGVWQYTCPFTDINPDSPDS
jgi:hypothetical protein